MTMRTKGSQITVAMICVMGLLLTFMTGLIIPASASTETEGGSIVLNCLPDSETPLPGQEWKLYKVGERSNGDFTLADSFKDCTVTFTDSDNDGVFDEEAVKQNASTLETYAKDNSIAALLTATSDENGNVTFSGLENGLYLISGTYLEYNGKAYTSSPSLIEINLDDADMTNVTAKPKYSIENVPEDSQPDSSSDVESSVPDTSSEDVTSSDESGTGSGTDSFNKPDSEVDSSSTTSTTSSTVSTTTSSTAGTSSSSDSIPQTGQLWWPVPILSIAGLTLIALGWRVHSKKDE